jgi:hypothetical protein
MLLNSGWVEEEVRWEGRPARAFVYFMSWKDVEAEERFKKRERWGQTLRVIDFIRSFERVGMLGYTDTHGYFSKT